jgi:hypothetical protein
MQFKLQFNSTDPRLNGVTIVAQDTVAKFLYTKISKLVPGRTTEVL